MDAASLSDGFRVGDWLIEPRSARATGSAGRPVELTQQQTQLLVALATRHGEAVPKRELRAMLWPGTAGSEERLRETVSSLRSLFGEDSRHPRYIASVGHDAYALVAHFDRAPQASCVDEPPRRVARLHRLLSELRRRNVVKVAVSYLVAMWIVLQVAEVTFAPLRFPDWWMTALTIIAIIGLPIVVALAWTYEITPQGVVLDPGSDRAGVVKLHRPRARQTLAPALVGGVALMAVVTGFAWWRSIDARVETSRAAAGAPEPGLQSIAILPLVDLSPAGGNAWLGDGLSEELSTRLAQVPGMRVAARTSAFEYRGKNVDVRRIGQSLGVRHVLEGSVRREGDEVRVAVQLIDARTGYHVWAGNFDRAWRDVLVLQDDIARSVTDALEVVLAGPSSATSTAVDARALDPYFEGLALLRQPGDASLLRRGENAFRAAIDIAPQFAAAHAGLCRVLSRRFEVAPDPTVLAEAERSCRRALALDASLVDTERALAALYASDDRFNQAIEIYRRLLERNPTDAGVQLELGEALDGLGLDQEAEQSLARAVALDPAFGRAHTSLGRFYFHRGRPDEAVAAFTRAAELAPASASAWSNVGGAAQMKGDMETAIRAYDKSLKLEKSATAYSNLATAQYFTGRFAEAVQNFERALVLNPHDQILRGNLADALWAIDARRQEAVALYRDAIAKGEAQLAKNPEDATLRAQLGFYYGRTGDPARAEAYIADAVAKGPEKVYVQYYRAVAAADRGDRAAALTGVAELLRVGYPRAMLRMAPEFRNLSQDAEYVKMMKDG
ncbi:MAG TPA: tetratricopeptide repeat protein [Steroidobacteraceae bacterium]|nr:tetratricopeptide repeat protein [Steroidobacteraceae bacterium]